MIVFEEIEENEDQLFRRGSIDHYIDLRQAKTADEIIQSVAKVFRGEHSSMGGLIANPNLNWLNDIAFDFFNENWGKRKWVVMVGVGHVINMDPVLFINILDIINCAFVDYIAEQSHFGEKEGTVHDEILEQRFILTLSLA